MAEPPSSAHSDRPVEAGSSDWSALDAGAMNPPDAPAPEFIGERYRVNELLGRGGMASVYRVTAVADGRTLALKQLTLQADRRRQTEVAARGHRGARAAQRFAGLPVHAHTGGS